jgi:hypothetical protein
MKLNSLSLAKLVILLSVGIGATSALYADKTKAKVLVAKQNSAKLEKEVRDTGTAKNELSRILTKNVSAQRLDAVVATLMVRILAERLSTGITIGSMSPGKQVSTSGTATFDQLADPLDGTDIRTVRLNVRGSYETYEGLLQYVSKLRELPVSVVQLKIEARQFEIGVRAYGI